MDHLQYNDVQTPGWAAPDTLLRCIIDCATDLMAALDLDGRFLIFNRAYEEHFLSIFGTRIAVGMSIYDALAHLPHEQSRARDIQGRLLKGEAYTWQAEYAGVDGISRFYEANCNLLYDNQGSPMGCLAILHDITERVQIERALRASEARLEEAQALARIGSWEFDLATQRAHWSKEMFRLAERDPALGAPSYEEHRNTYLPEDAARLDAAVQNAIHHGAGYELDLRWKAQDGTIRCWHAIGNPVRDETGKVIKLIGTRMDVTDKRAADQEREAALRRAEELTQLSDLTLDLIAIADHEGHFTTVNPAWTRVLGYPLQELLATPITSLIHPDDIETTLAESARLVAASAPMVAFENRYRASDGTYRWLSWNAIAAPTQGKVYGVARDVTERKRIEQALRASEERLRAVLDQLPAGIIFAEAPSGRMLLTNREMDRIHGRPLTLFASLAEYNNPGLRWPDGTQMAREDYPLVRAIQRGEVISQEEVLIERTDGTRLACAINAAPMYNDRGEIVAGILALTDIDARKKLQQQFHQAQKMEGIGRLAGGIAHDFNNLLSVIIGYAELIEEDLAESSPQSDRIRTVADAAARASRLTRELLSFARSQPGNPAIICPNQQIQDMLPLLHPLIGKEVHLRTHLDTLVGNLRLDPHHLEQVVVNLVVNARDAMPNGGTLTIQTSTEHVETNRVHPQFVIPAGRYIILSISDTGTGMTAEVQARLFEPFFTTKPVGKGTGLGLATVYGIVTQNDGYIYVESEADRGTTFKIYLREALAKPG